MSLASFNAASAPQAEAAMLSCCASRAFASLVAGGRPYPSAEALLAAVASAVDSLAWDDVLEALAGHPRIGARVTGVSAAEQSGVTDSSRAALATANRAYEDRFGHVFLICASGLSGADLLAAVQARLLNNPQTERAVATTELRKITVLRARKLMTADARAAGPPAESAATISTHVLDATAGAPAVAVRVTLEARSAAGSWDVTDQGETGGDGRLRFPGSHPAGEYRLTFGTGDYFAARGAASFYPQVTVTFAVSAGHYHVPLLLSPFGYSTYRGS